MATPNSGASSLDDKSHLDVDEKNPQELGLEGFDPNFKKSWFRSVFFQITITGLTAFLSPGLWNSMASLGAGGQQTPFLANAANSIVFGLMVLTCLLGSSIVNRIGYRWALVLGALGYAPYAGGLLLNLRTKATWLVYFGSVTCGLSAGLFWAVEGAIVMGYPSAPKRGRYLAYWLAFRNGGSILGGSITLGLNAKTNKAGSISNPTYITLIVLQAIAPFVATLISTPSQVQRPERTPVKMQAHLGFVPEMKQIWAVMTRKEVLLLTPIALFAQWPSSYAGTFLSLYFTVRARSLGALLNAILGVISNTLLGLWLDNKRYSIKTRARVAFVVVFTILGGSLMWLLGIQKHYVDVTKATGVAPKFDWSHKGFANPFAAYLVFFVGYFTVQNLLYWSIALLAREEQELLRLSSFLRAFESAGSACGYGISSRKKLPYTVAVGIDVGGVAVAAITAIPTILKLGVDFFGAK
ncbi:MFS general substrate transporter [Meredithblackwellia eburnea MCA 4105]